MTYPLVNNGGFESVSRRSSKDWPQVMIIFAMP